MPTPIADRWRWRIVGRMARLPGGAAPEAHFSKLDLTSVSLPRQASGLVKRHHAKERQGPCRRYGPRSCTTLINLSGSRAR